MGTHIDLALVIDIAWGTHLFLQLTGTRRGRVEFEDVVAQAKCESVGLCQGSRRTQKVLKALPDIKEDGPGTHLSVWDNRC